MGYACDPKTVHDAMKSMEYHKRVPRKQKQVRPDDKQKQVAWRQARLHRTKGHLDRRILLSDRVIRNAGEGDYTPTPAAKLRWFGVPSAVLPSLIFPAEQRLMLQPTYGA